MWRKSSVRYLASVIFLLSSVSCFDPESDSTKILEERVESFSEMMQQYGSTLKVETYKLKPVFPLRSGSSLQFTLTVLTSLGINQSKCGMAVKQEVLKGWTSSGSLGSGGASADECEDLWRLITTLKKKGKSILATKAVNLKGVEWSGAMCTYKTQEGLTLNYLENRFSLIMADKTFFFDEEGVNIFLWNLRKVVAANRQIQKVNKKQIE
jgi:hypothetical protein